MNLVQTSLATDLGRLYLVASDIGLRGVYFCEQPVPTSKNNALLVTAATQLKEYFARRRKDFELPLDWQGTAFQTQVWKQLCRIPYGKTCSYKDVAVRLKNPKAVRAVGGANGKNPLCIIAPCHRVIAADGGLGGYTGGLEIKRFLLDLESRGLKPH